MKLKQYLLAVEKVFKFRIKTLFPLEDATMDLLEKALQKYRPNSVSKPIKMMGQTNPLGFTGAKFAEVYMCDVELTVPVTPTLLQYDLRAMMGLPQNDETLKVFGENDPSNEPLESQEDDDALLSTDHYDEVEDAKFEDYYGDEYNKHFVKYLNKVNKEAAEKAKRGNVDAKHPLTKWANQPKADLEDPEQPHG